MKTRYASQREVAHAWAHQLSLEGRCGGNLFFDSTAIYSYGGHFPIAVHWRGAVLFTGASYSVSTSRHCLYVRQAIPDSVPVIQLPAGVPDWEPYAPGHLWRHFTNAHRRALEACTKPRLRAPGKACALAALESIIDNANRYAELAGIPDRLAMPGDADLAAVRAVVAEQDRRAMERARQAEAEGAAKLELWTQGHPDGSSYVAHSNARLRIASDGETVETSKGARFPVADARRAWPLVQACLAGREYPGGLALGGYHVDRIGATGLVAGCHRIEAGELARFAAVLGLA